jgi:glycosyltransferase involved in cell wall biosynthesis
MMGDASAPTVSVVIPAFNAAATLAKTLESAARQTYEHLDIVVVDDGSNDATPDIAADAARVDPRIRLLRQENAGVVRARNAGLRASAGDFVAPLDADDLWARTKIERQLRRIAEAGDNCSMVYCWSADIDENDRVVARRHDVDRYEGDVLAAMMVGNFIGNASAPLIRRRTFEGLGYWDERLGAEGGQGCADWLGYLNLAAAGAVALEPAFLVGYRQTAGSMSRDVDQMRHAFNLVQERMSAAHPNAPARLRRWAEAAYDIYCWELSGGTQWSLLLRGVLGDPSWLARRSTRSRLRRWWRKTVTPDHPDNMIPNLALADRCRFDEMDVELHAELTDGRMVEKRRALLQAMRV